MIPHNIRRVGIVSQSDLFNLSTFTQMAAAHNKAQALHFGPIWGRMSTVAAYQNLKNVPLGVVPAVCKDDIGQPGALGYHDNDRNGQPRIFFASQGGNLSGVSQCFGHENNEMNGDPTGNRLVVVPDFDDPSKMIQLLVEVSDPPEDLQYFLDGFAMSDFYFPEWLDSVAVAGRQYTYMNAIPTPRTIINGGYCSYIKDGQWFQKTWFSGSTPITEGPFNWERKPDETLRMMVDRNVREKRAALGIK